MITGMKTVRAARPTPYHKDNFDDAANYLMFANDFHPDNISDDVEDDPIVTGSEGFGREF